METVGAHLQVRRDRVRAPAEVEVVREVEGAVEEVLRDLRRAEYFTLKNVTE